MNLGLGELFDEIARATGEREHAEELERRAASPTTKEYLCLP